MTGKTLNVSLSGLDPGLCNIYVCNMAGQLVESRIVNYEEKTLWLIMPVDCLPSGQYYLHLSTAAGRNAGVKFIKPD